MGHQASRQGLSVLAYQGFKSCSLLNSASCHPSLMWTVGTRLPTTARGRGKHQGQEVWKPGLEKESWWGGGSTSLRPAGGWGKCYGEEPSLKPGEQP